MHIMICASRSMSSKTQCLRLALPAMLEPVRAEDERQNDADPAYPERDERRAEPYLGARDGPPEMDERDDDKEAARDRIVILLSHSFWLTSNPISIAPIAQ